jgi:hypothetical protein
MRVNPSVRRVTPLALARVAPRQPAGYAEPQAWRYQPGCTKG